MKRLTEGCARTRRAPVGDIQFAHCDACLERLLREAFGPVSWHYRVRTQHAADDGVGRGAESEAVLRPGSSTPCGPSGHAGSTPTTTSRSTARVALPPASPICGTMAMTSPPRT